MDDAGQYIKVKIETSDLSADEEMKSKERVVLGYVLWRGRTNNPLTLTVYVKRNDTLQWEAIKTYTIATNTKRFFRRLPPSVSCIDAYVKLEGEVNTFELTSLKLFIKPVGVGQYG